MTEQWYSEALLASRLGITRTALDDFRRGSLKKNEAKKIGRQNFISESALKKLLAKLGSDGLDCSSCLLHSANGVVLVELVVTKVHLNPHLIQAANEAGQRVLVYVQKNKNFRPRMKLKARPPNEPPASQLYRLEGRCPRFPGKW